MIDCLKKKTFIKRKFSSQKNLKSEVISRKFVVVARKEKKTIGCTMYNVSIFHTIYIMVRKFSRKKFCLKKRA